MRKISEIYVNGVCLIDILGKHEKWLNEEDGGERADLSYANLSYTDLSRVDLNDADLSYANLVGADLNDVDLSCADLRCADLKCASLKGANLNYADLSGTDLRCADLSYTDLRGTVLKDIDLRGSNLCCADLRGVNLNKALYNHQTSFFAPICPEEGSFIGYKKANDKIIKLLITEDAKRSSATTRKCRCSKAKVLSITNLKNTEEFSEVASKHDNNFIYRVGETVEVKEFDEDRWNECSTGIHFFITRDEAVMYCN